MTTPSEIKSFPLAPDVFLGMSAKEETVSNATDAIMVIFFIYLGVIISSRNVEPVIRNFVTTN